MKSNFPAFHRWFAEGDSSGQAAVITRYAVCSKWQPLPLYSVVLFCDEVVVFGVVSRELISKISFLPVIRYIISHYLILQASVISDNTVYI